MGQKKEERAQSEEKCHWRGGGNRCSTTDAEQQDKRIQLEEIMGQNDQADRQVISPLSVTNRLQCDQVKMI